MFDLNGKVAIVTGANQGLGFAMCQGLAKAGADIFNIGRREDDHVIREAIEKEGVKYHYYRADLSNPTVEKMDEIVEEVIKVYGHVDILLNNAGANIREPFLEYDVKDWDYILNLNLKSIFLLSQSVAKQMVAQKTKGKIINISSVSGVTGNAGQANYSASKAGIIGLTKSAARELASRNINVNAIAPGFVDTDMTITLSDKVKEGAKGQIPLGRFGKPEEVAELALFLSSEKSDYITGQVINIDGGMVM